jgi:hypothetical protein
VNKRRRYKVKRKRAFRKAWLKAVGRATCPWWISQRPFSPEMYRALEGRLTVGWPPPTDPPA